MQNKRSSNLRDLSTDRMIVNSLEMSIRKSFILMVKDPTLTKNSIRQFEILIYTTFTYHNLAVSEEENPVVVICYWSIELLFDSLK